MGEGREGPGDAGTFRKEHLCLLSRAHITHLVMVLRARPGPITQAWVRQEVDMIRTTRDNTLRAGPRPLIPRDEQTTRTACACVRVVGEGEGVRCDFVQGQSS